VNTVSYLQEEVDIHTGGIDHIPVHHTNEIAQSESATGKQFARFWMHSAHMMVDGQKMSKSLGNTYTLADLEKHDISPLAFRYWLLTANYRTQVNFTWETVVGAQKAYDKLRQKIYELKKLNKIRTTPRPFKGHVLEIFNDIDTSSAIAEIHKIIQGNEYPPAVVLSKIKSLDAVLGLKLLSYKPKTIRMKPDLKKLFDERKIAYAAKNYAESDRLRDEIKKLGYEVKDTSDGQVLFPL
jgi:cysteinyl-tRNA synthetase